MGWQSGSNAAPRCSWRKSKQTAAPVSRSLPPQRETIATNRYSTMSTMSTMSRAEVLEHQIQHAEKLEELFQFASDAPIMQSQRRVVPVATESGSAFHIYNCNGRRMTMKTGSDYNYRPTYASEPYRATFASEQGRPTFASEPYRPTFASDQYRPTFASEPSRLTITDPRARLTVLGNSRQSTPVEAPKQNQFVLFDDMPSLSSSPSTATECSLEDSCCGTEYEF
ncbi:hypothetical protein THRCLA_21840 [Thraustotheca clavata]|uniref:Uncharacterized protein n=1 Tax=Thraustotheca clavata TaxID=74557 RepID=A0A1V9ZN68_9STRA|nr:hypothetical protein THRCLA_21840 [Thraustotheca clavata]